MNWYFIFVQALDLIAWGLLVLSYYRKDTNRILTFQLLATFFYCLHYYFLGAMTGLAICVFEIIRDYLYYKTDKDDYIFLFSAIVFIIISFFTFETYANLLPIIAGLIDGYTLTKKKNVVVLGAVISYSIWVIYCFCIGSYAGALTDGILVVSNLSILLFHYDLFKGKDTSGVFPKK